MHSLFSILATIFFFGVLFSALSAVAVMLADEITSHKLCLKNECLANLATLYSAPIAILKFFIDLLMFSATIGGIFIALMNYLSSVNTSRFTNHISHLTLFQSFFIEEVRKRERLSLSSFDTHKIYSMIFPGSRDGVLIPGLPYSEFISKLNSAIDESNEKFRKGSIPPFNYQQHQSKMIECLNGIGFSLQYMPKIDFYEIENQIIDLLETINKSFLGDRDKLTITKRIYR